MNDDNMTKSQISGAGLLAGTSLAGAQYAAQYGHYRTQALQIALQASAGTPRKVPDIIADAELILAWIAPQPAA